MSNEETRTEPKRCAGTCKDGRACSVATLVDGRFCFAHSPKTVQARDEARAKGGQNSARLIRFHRAMSPRVIPSFELLQSAIIEVHEGNLSPSRLNAIANGCRALVALLEAGEMDARYAALEAQIQQLQALKERSA